MDLRSFWDSSEVHLQKVEVLHVEKHQSKISINPNICSEYAVITLEKHVSILAV